MTFFVGVGPRLMHKIPANGKPRTLSIHTITTHPSTNRINIPNYTNPINANPVLAPPFSPILSPLYPNFPKPV